MAIITPAFLDFLNRWPRRITALTLLALACLSALNGAASNAGAKTDSKRLLVVAARHIPVGTAFTSNDLRLQPWPAELLPKNALTDISEGIDRRALTPLEVGEPITTTRLVGTDLATGLNPGEVAIPVELPDTTSAALFRPGDHISLLSGSANGMQPAPSGVAPGRELVTAARVLAVLPLQSPGSTTATQLVIATSRTSAALLAGNTWARLVAVRTGT